MSRRRSGRSSLIYTLLVIALIILIYYLRPSINLNTTPATSQTSTSQTSIPVTGGVPQWGHQTKTSGCQVSGGLQDKACTPGDILPDATKEQICQSGYAQTVRNVPTSEKNQVYDEYGIVTRSPGQYEVDHLVSLELGGSNDISNLWPEAASPQPGFHEKDKVENYLHDQVCSGAISLQDAQVQIANNWLEVYNQMNK